MAHQVLIDSIGVEQTASITSGTTDLQFTSALRTVPLYAVQLCADLANWPIKAIDVAAHEPY